MNDKMCVAIGPHYLLSPHTAASLSVKSNHHLSIADRVKGSDNSPSKVQGK